MCDPQERTRDHTAFHNVSGRAGKLLGAFRTGETQRASPIAIGIPHSQYLG